MACINYAGGFAVGLHHYDKNPIEQKMDEFLKEEVEFDQNNQMPTDVRSWTQVSKIVVVENKANKEVVRTCKKDDGTEVQCKYEEERTLGF